MQPDIARAALQFLARVDLKGAEAPALMQVLAAIERFTVEAPQKTEESKPDPT